MKNDLTILDKIKNCAEQNNVLLHISGSKQAKIKYGKTLDNPYKIITTDIDKKFFKGLCAQLCQTRDLLYYRPTFGGYSASFNDGIYNVTIDTDFNGHNTICLYKIK